GSVLDKMVCVVVDNRLCPDDIVVMCPDTGYQFIVAAGAVKMAPLFSTTNVIWVADPIIALSLNLNTLIFTRIFITNFIIQGFQTDSRFKSVGLEQKTVLSSTVRSFMTGVLGDIGEVNFPVIGNAAVNGTVNFALFPFPAGQYVFTNLEIALFGVYR